MRCLVCVTISQDKIRIYYDYRQHVSRLNPSEKCCFARLYDSYVCNSRILSRTQIETMKSPWIIVCLAVVYITLPTCSGDEPLVLWTQQSSIWSYIRGVRGDILSWMRGDPQTQHTYIRSESMIHSLYFGITYDHLTDTVCWSDVLHHGIFCQPFSYTAIRNTTRIRSIVSDQSLNIRGISVDWQTGNVYFAAGRSIAVAPSRDNGGNVYKFLLSRGFENVSGIAVDTDANLIFWTDSKTSQISCATLAGKERRELYNTGGRPMGIAVVPAERRVYWVDNSYGNLESVQYDGTHQKRHIEDDHGKDFTGLVIHSDYALITGTASLKLHCYRRTPGSYQYMISTELDANPFFLTALDIYPSPPTHDCDWKGCHHICLNLGEGKGVCVCKTGYLLSPDGVSCTERQPRYVYTTGREVLFATATIDYTNTGRVHLSQSEIVRDRDDIRALGFHYGKNKLFFSDTSADVIFRCDPDSGVLEEHTVNTGNVEGIAIDWLTSNVYWTDHDLGHIMVSQLDGRYHKILVPNAGTPTGIAVDARQSRMFWNDATEGREKVLAANLDGTAAYGIVDFSDGVMHPQGIFLDPHNQQLYWVDKDLGVIECVDYEGRNRKPVLERAFEDELYYDVTLYQDLTAWTDVNGGLRFRNILTDEDLEISADFTQNTRNEAYDIIAYDPYLQPQSTSPCDESNGRCQQLCFPVSRERMKCGCAIGFTLNTDERSCDSVTLKEYFVLFTDPYHKQVYQSNLSLESQESNGLHLPLMDYPISVDYDSGKGRVFWIDLIRNEFKRSKINGDDEKVIRMFPVGSRPLRLAVDSVMGWVYYTDWERGTVSRLKVDASAHEDIITNLHQPFGVAVDYESQKIAWTHGNKIEISDTDGTNRRILDDRIPLPSGVAFLPGEQMLYSCDNDTGTIYSYNLTTGTRTLVYEYRAYHIYSVAASPTHLYFSTFNQKGVYRVDRHTGQGLSTVGDPVFARVTDVKVVQGSVVPVYSEGGGFPWVILAGVLAGLLLLLLVLLAAILGVRRKKRAAKDPESRAVNNELDTDREYAYLNQSTLFDIRGSHNAMNNTVNGHPAGQTNGDLPATGFDDVNAGSENIYSGVLPTPDVLQGSDIANADGVYVEANGELNGSNGTHNDSNGAHHDSNGAQHGSNGVPVGGVAVVGVSTEAIGTAAIAAAKRSKYKQKNKKSNDKRKKKTISRDPEFEFSPENKVATRIQRLANRLRNRLSSVRWSQSDKDEDVGPNPDQAPTLQAIGPERTGPAGNKRLVHIPPTLHQMPRGFAPASHCVPRNMKTSLTGAKVKNMVDKGKTTEVDDTPES